MIDVEKALGRKQHDPPVEGPLRVLRDARVLVTGAEGSLGSLLVPLLREAQITVDATDLDTLDVRHWPDVWTRFKAFEPTVVFHLAGAKQAPDGEDQPERVTETNVVGTSNVVEHAKDARVVLASTCKACEAETVYGASKLIAERVVLNAGGSVARLYNVVDTQGNVFELWHGLPEHEPVPVTKCDRYLISAQEAVGLFLWAAVLPPGRYTVDPGYPRFIPQVAATLYPGRPQRLIPPRRGDRIDELLHARSERLTPIGPSGLRQIQGRHDQLESAARAA